MSVSLSQSVYICSTSSVSHEVNPLVQSSFRLRDQNVANHVLRVSSSASGFANPTMSISPVSLSWAIVGMRLSGYFAKSSEAEIVFWEFIKRKNKWIKIRLFWRIENFCKVTQKILPPMREKMVPDILPRLFLFGEEIHRVVVIHDQK
mgnify:CR=1 FL=1